MVDIDMSLASADAAGLRYVSGEGPGIRRQRRGTGFSYQLPDGSVVSQRIERDRIAALAIPPAWTDVWICPAPDGHILATGHDDKGRKQYRYHPGWNRIRLAVPEAFRSGRLGELWPRARKTQWLDRPERLVQRLLAD